MVKDRLHFYFMANIIFMTVAFLLMLLAGTLKPSPFVSTAMILQLMILGVGFYAYGIAGGFQRKAQSIERDEKVWE